MYSFSSIVRYSECDTDGFLTTPALINYLQDCSTLHTESVRHGVAFLAEHHFAWVIAAWQIEIARMPRFTEPITVSTWCHSMRATNANRNFLIQSEAGKTLVKADSLWLTYDTQNMRPMRIPDGEEVYLTDDEPLDLPPMRRKIKLAGKGVAQPQIVVAAHHIDTNDHVNNGQYVAMADDVLRAQGVGFVPARIAVQYKSMARLGDVIVPYLHEEEAGYAVNLTDGQGSSYAIVRLER